MFFNLLNNKYLKNQHNSIIKFYFLPITEKEVASFEKSILEIFSSD